MKRILFLIVVIIGMAIGASAETYKYTNTRSIDQYGADRTPGYGTVTAVFSGKTLVWKHDSNRGGLPDPVFVYSHDENGRAVYKCDLLPDLIIVSPDKKVINYVNKFVIPNSTEVYTQGAVSQSSGTFYE